MIRRFLLMLTALAVLAVLAGGAVYWWALRDVPWADIEAGLAVPDSPQAEMTGVPPSVSDRVPLDAFPRHLVDAVVTIEDRRFFDHWGVDWRGIARAFLRNLDAGEVVEGGSTITQQLIKISYLDRQRTYRRKVQELVIALWLERRLGKEEVLTRYLNDIYLGAGATGVAAAARVYFGKEPQDLTLAESALIAGAIIAPSVLNPQANPARAAERAAVVLNAMVENGRIGLAEAQAARDEIGRLVP